MAAVAEEIGLKNVTTQHSRIEDIRNRKFDYVVSRAVAPLKDLWRWSRPLIKTKTQVDTDTTGAKEAAIQAPGLICLKGGELDTEIQESMTRPRLMRINEIFQEPLFDDKYILYVPR